MIYLLGSILYYVGLCAWPLFFGIKFLENQGTNDWYSNKIKEQKRLLMEDIKKSGY